MREGGRSEQDCGRDGGRGVEMEGGWASEMWCAGMEWVGEVLWMTRLRVEGSQSTPFRKTWVSPVFAPTLF